MGKVQEVVSLQMQTYGGNIFLSTATSKQAGKSGLDEICESF